MSDTKILQDISNTSKREDVPAKTFSRRLKQPPQEAVSFSAGTMKFCFSTCIVNVQEKLRSAGLNKDIFN